MRRFGLTWREWLGLAAGLLAVVALFLPWTTLSASDPQIAGILRDLPAGDVGRAAWRSGFFAWCPPLLLVLAGAAVALFGRVRSVRSAGLPQLWLMAAVLALLLMVLGWFLLDQQFTDDQRAVLSAGGVVIGAGTGRYLAMVAAAVSIVAAVLDVRDERASRVPRRGRPSRSVR